MRHHYLIIILITILTIQCKDNATKSTQIEILLAKRYQADKVTLTQNKVQTTINGVLSDENYLLIELFNPKPIIDMKFNERVLENKCNEINNYLQDSIRFPSGIDYNEVRVKIIEVNGLIFETEKSTIFKYHRKY